MSFRFKQFTVEDDLSSMRVGTDSVLLGSWIKADNALEIMDIGTGCGIIALMMAQKSKASITAIDIDRDSASQASRNFGSSPWTGRMMALNVSFMDFVNHHNGQFDLITANPPWFSNSLKSPHRSRNIARHDDLLKPDDLFSGVKKLLTQNGSFYIIIPADSASSTALTAREYSLFLNRQMIVRPKPEKDPNRILMEFSFTAPDQLFTEEITIRNSDNSFTDAYLAMTKDFYLDF